MEKENKEIGKNTQDMETITNQDGQENNSDNSDSGKNEIAIEDAD